MIPKSFFQFEDPFSIKLGENCRPDIHILLGSGDSLNGCPNEHLTQNIDTTPTLDFAKKEMVGDKTKEDKCR